VSPFVQVGTEGVHALKVSAEGVHGLTGEHLQYLPALTLSLTTEGVQRDEIEHLQAQKGNPLAPFSETGDLHRFGLSLSADTLAIALFPSRDAGQPEPAGVRQTRAQRPITLPLTSRDPTTSSQSGKPRAGRRAHV